MAGAGDGGAIHNKALAGTANATTFSGPVILTANATVYDDVSSTSITAFSGGISGPYTLTLDGSGSYVLSGVNTQPALTLNNSGGTTQLSGSGTLGAPNVTLTFSQNSAKLDLNGTNQTIGTINNNFATILNNATGTASVLTINGGATTGTVFADHTAGTGTLGLTVGGGTLALSGASTYTGATTVIGGTLASRCGHRRRGHPDFRSLRREFARDPVRRRDAGFERFQRDHRFARGQQRHRRHGHQFRCRYACPDHRWPEQQHLVCRHIQNGSATSVA